MTQHPRQLIPAALAAVLATALVTTACGQTATVRGSETVPDAQISRACPQSTVTPSPGAPSTLGFNARGVRAPAWSSNVGHVQAVYGSVAYTESGDSAECVRAVNTANGQQLWSWAAPALPEVMGITTGRAAAGLGIVLVATGKLNRAPASSGTAPANPGGVVSSPPAEFELVDHLTALNAGTGQRLWNLSLPADGQTVPAALADGNVIVTEADGTVIALDARTGARRWTDGLPPGCRSNDPIAPMAQIVSSAASLTVLYPCAKASQVAALSPGTGATQWTWTAPRAWSVNQPVAAVTTEDVTTEGVTAFLVSGPGTAAPQRASWTLGPSAAGGPNQVVAVDDSTGRPLWELNDVDASASLYAGAGEICADSSYGAECLDARTGTESWQWRPAIVPIPSQEPGPLLGGAAVGHGDLYVIAPTPAAAKIDSSSTTQQSAPGTFDLRLMSLATGRVLASQPLPAYYGGGNGTVVSLGSPPGVAAVSGHLALVTPQASETEVIEALNPNAS